MVSSLKKNSERGPLGLVVTGEAQWWLPALESIIGPQLLKCVQVDSDAELLDVVSRGGVDAAVLDDEAQWSVDVLKLLRMIRRLDRELPVVVVTKRRDRRLLEDALRLTAFSVMVKPLALEELLRQIQRMMDRIDRRLRRGL
ncbi:MAG: response regulator [Phycisphaerae bacterium]|jgi:DNA-binding NtrC family response regulator|nr:response regulator [Phycisphaerae bacterium]